MEYALEESVTAPDEEEERRVHGGGTVVVLGKIDNHEDSNRVEPQDQQEKGT
jgi:hypothetical protein